MSAGSEGRKAELVRREEIYRGRIVHLGRETVRFPDGTTGTLEIVRHPGAAAVVPFLDHPSESLDPRVLLIHQFRYAASGTIYEVPAGLPRDADESWEACARRELREETGYEATDLHRLTRIFTTPGFTDEVIVLFAATGLRAGEAERDRDEFIEIEPLPFSRVLEMIRSGQISDGKSVAALLYAWIFFRSPPGGSDGPARG